MSNLVTVPSQVRCTRPLFARERQARLLAAAFCLTFLACTSTLAEEEPLAWVHRDKIRMGWTPSSLDDYDAMARAGMNAVMPRIELDAAVDYDPEMSGKPLSDYDAEVGKALQDSARKAKEAGLRYFHCLDIAARSQTLYVGTQDNSARWNDTDFPSPVDPVYWRRAIVDRVRRALDFLAGDEYALDAVIIDPEMYTLQGVVPRSPDYGAYAFKTFLDDRGTEAPVAADTPDKRREWLTTESVHDAFLDWQRDRIVAMAKELREVIRARRPHAILGFIIYRDELWFNAMAEGLSTPEIPVFIGPETTYSGVMDESFVQYAESLREKVKVPCLFVPGIRMGLEEDRVPAEFLKMLPGNLYQRCQYSEGYWVWAIYRFGEGQQRDAFFSVLRCVNETLDHQAETGEVDASLVAAPLPVELPADFQLRFTEARELVPVNTPTLDTKPTIVPPQLRGPHTLFLWPRPGEQETLTVRARKLGNLLSATTVRIVGPDGHTLWEDTISIGDTRVLRIPAVDGGPCAALISAGMNAYQVVDATCPAMLCQGEAGVHVCGRGLLGTFFFYVPPNREAFTIRVNGHSVEHVDYVLTNPRGEIVREWKVLKKTEEARIEHAMPGIWSIAVENAIDDAGFALVDLPNRFALRAADVYAARE